MKLYEAWEALVGTEMSPEEHAQFWKGYFDIEKDMYDQILKSKNSKLEGTVKELAENFDVEEVIFAGFLDGINTSLTEEISLAELEETTVLDSEIDFEKLLYNMHNAKAKWLYKLKSWDGVLSKEQRKEIKKKYDEENTASSVKIGRNDPCPCGSGKKFKKCCLNKVEEA